MSNVRIQRASAVAGALLAAATIGCQPQPPAAPLLTDPREILTRGIDVNASLRTVHLRAEASMRTSFPGEPMPDEQRATLDVDVDFTTGNLAASGAADDPRDQMGLIVVNGTTFTLNASTGRWVQMPNVGGVGGLLGLGLFGMPGAQGPDLRALLRDVVADERVVAELAGVDGCGGVDCYRVRVTIPPEVLWHTLVTVMGMGNGGVAGGLGAMPPGIPPLSTELLFETSTLVLVESRISIAVDGNSLDASVQLSAHDAPIAIQPPPPHLIERFVQGFGAAPAS